MPENLDMDDDGYPSDAVLDLIRDAKPKDGGASWLVRTFPLLAASVPCCDCTVTKVADMFGEATRIEFTTGGWSGAEDLVGAVIGNPMLRLLFYAEWRRGGFHAFEIPDTRLTPG